MTENSAREAYTLGLNCKQNDKAIEYYTEAIRLNQNFEEAYFNRGLLYVIKKNKDKAIADFKSVLKINPNNTEAQYYIEKFKLTHNNRFLIIAIIGMLCVISLIVYLKPIFFATKIEQLNSTPESINKSSIDKSTVNASDNSFSSLKITAPELAYIPVKAENGLYKYISLSGKSITNAIFKNAYMFSEGLAMVQLQNDSYAFIDTLGNQIACCYDLATQFKEGVAWVLNGDDIKLIDNKGNKNPETPMGIDAVWSFYEGYALFSAYGKQSYVDKRFNFIGGGIYYVDGNRFQEGFAGVKCDNGKYGFINNAGKLAISCEYDEVKGFKNGLAVVKKGKSWGTINKNGGIAINLNSTIELLISDGDLFRFQDKSTKKWGWLNNKGQVVINAIFEESNPFFNNSIAPVKYNGVWVFIGKKGNYPIRTPFKYAYPLYNERALVQFADDTWGTIDSSGDIKLKTDYTKLAPSYWNLAVSGAHSGPKLEKKGK
ncbi:hypothetical protein AGMMS49938_07570 [Fibrobacterales bacterium]|nr:hypothetical protein AGMMS49938_07570 [Fibrobacterales bacterium]